MISGTWETNILVSPTIASVREILGSVGMGSEDMGKDWWNPWIEETEPGKAQVATFSGTGEEPAAQRELHTPAETPHGISSRLLRSECM